MPKNLRLGIYKEEVLFGLIVLEAVKSKFGQSHLTQAVSCYITTWQVAPHGRKTCKSSGWQVRKRPNVWDGLTL
jgi:hypothetical protein